MKRLFVVLIHIGYWWLYCLLLLFMYGLVTGIKTAGENLTEGVGLGLTRKNKEIIVDYIFPRSPAEKVKVLKKGDVILGLSIGDSAAFDLAHTKVSTLHRHLMHVQERTQVHLLVQRKGSAPEKVELVGAEFYVEPPPTFGNWILLLSGCGLIPGLVAFYGFYLFLFPRFLSRRKWLAFCLGALLVGFLAVIPGEAFLRFSFWEMPWKQEVYTGFATIILVNALLNGAMAMVIRGFITWFREMKLKEELAQKNLNMELALIRSQINPHFLFNTLNNIDGLILKDPPAASSYLIRLSDILRFMLYDTSTGKVPLQKELDHIQKYIDLQKIRTDNPGFIDYSVTGEPDGLQVEPMMFMPFIENAFKHTENKKIDKAIEIKLKIENSRLHFECRNRYQSGGQMRPEYGGLGNELITRRLDLLYPGKHKLEVRDEDQVYSVTLVLDL